MRILYLIHQYLPQHCAGTEVYTHSLARCLASVHEVLVFCHEAALDGGDVMRQSDSYQGVAIERVAAWTGDRRPKPWQMFRYSYSNVTIEHELEALLDRFQPHVVHVQHLKDLSAGVLGIIARRRIPIVMTLHDYWALCPNAQSVRPNRTICLRTHARLECGLCAADRLGQPALRMVAPLTAPLFWQRQYVMRQALRHVSRFISPSAFLQERYVAAGFDGARISILENGLDTSRLAGAGADPKPPYRGHFAFVGSLAWQKGVHVLIQAAELLRDTDIEIRIWGDPGTFPDYSAGLHRAAHGMSRVKLLGALPQDRIGEALAWADYLVVPSLWWENSPVTIQEAYAAGVPVIGSRLGAIPEKVRDGETGLLFAAGDAHDLAKLMLRADQRPALRDTLRADLPPVYDIQEHARAILAIYREVSGGV